MYLPEESRPIDFSAEAASASVQADIIVETSSGGEDQESIAPNPRKRSEAWTEEETRCLITFRLEVDDLFNTSRSHQHLWVRISAQMREKEFYRSPTMCCDRWSNLLKRHKKARRNGGGRGGSGGGGSVEMPYYEELEDFLKDKANKSPTPPKADSHTRFCDQVSGLEDASIPFGSVQAGQQSTVNLERQLNQDGDPLAITLAAAAAATDVSPQNSGETPVNVAGEENRSPAGRVISVRFGDYTRRIGIDGTADAIKAVIKAVFGLRTKREFWLEDEDEVARTLDRDMPIGNYVLHLDEGITIKLCHHDGLNTTIEEKTLYTQDDFSYFLGSHFFSSLKVLNGTRTVETWVDLQPGGMYTGVTGFRLFG